MQGAYEFRINESIVSYLNGVYPLQPWAKNLIGDEGKVERIISGRVFSQNIVNAPARIEHIIQELSYVGFGPEKYLVDLGVGDGRVLAVGHLMGGKVGGPEKMEEHAAVAFQKFDELRARGISTPPYDSIDVGKDIMEYDIMRADVVWAYMMADKQPEVVERFYAFAKPDAKLIIYHPSKECYKKVLQISDGVPFEGSIHDNTMIMNRSTWKPDKK